MTINHRVKLIIAKIKWFIKFVKIVIKIDGKELKIIFNLQREIKKEFLDIDKNKISEEDIDFIKAETRYKLINEIVKCLKD